MAVCYYKILGVSTRASQEEIKRAFRLMALRWHPDRNPQDPYAAERFREVVDAYENLIDPSKRGSYDSLRRPDRSKPAARHRRTRPSQEKASSCTVEEVLNQFFGVQFTAPRQHRGCDLRFDLQIPQSAAIEGTIEQIVFQRRVFCRKCTGNGHRIASSVCTKCQGMGAHEESCSLTVRIPAGSRQGTRLRVPGQGDRPSPTVPPGDLIIYLLVVEGERGA